MIVLSRSSATCVAGGGEGSLCRYAYSSSSTSQMFSGLGHLSGVDLSGDADLFLIESTGFFKQVTSQSSANVARYSTPR